ncbi:MAG: site-2 protease family protein [Proteobacteria bacterium]|nr:site-2 protease family protein [Pseudomonadota bacterium]
MGNLLYEITIWAIPVILAITLHEAAHGFVALKFGDDTALRAGRLTLNPVRHIDPFGTLLLPGLLLLMRSVTGSGFLFGWAKPVPVNFFRLRNPKRDMVWVAAAGPATNVALAFVSALLIHTVGMVPQSFATWWSYNLQNSVYINVLLAVFNMIPLPPLDGGRVAVGLLPMALARPLARLERTGMLILILALFIVPFAAAELLHTEFNPVASLIGPPFTALLRFILDLAGLR